MILFQAFLLYSCIFKPDLGFLDNISVSVGMLSAVSEIQLRLVTIQQGKF